MTAAAYLCRVNGMPNGCRHSLRVMTGSIGKMNRLFCALTTAIRARRTFNISSSFRMAVTIWASPPCTMRAGGFRIQLAWSADGLSWQRPSRVPWLDVGPENAFDCGMVLGPADPILWETEMWFP